MKTIYRLLREIGFDPRKLINLAGIPRYFKDMRQFKRKGGNVNLLFPCLNDLKENSGSASGHYFHQDLLVAQKIFKNKPLKHLDVGSRVDGFVAHVAGFRKIEVIDIRPQKNKIKNIHFLQGDLVNLSSKFFNKYDSVSSLHTVEHIGLGRYGDPIDPSGHIKAIENLKMAVKKNGRLYISVPISSNERVEFNAHRVFNIKTILSFFDDWKLLSFSYVDDLGSLHENISTSNIDSKNSFNCKWGCGIFEFKKQNEK